jgi:DNA-binding NtrC family response regulator
MGQLSPASQQTTVLVVEDEEPLRLAVAKLLAKAGFEVLQAANGSDAIHLLQSNGAKIELLLLDVTIPGVSSHEVLAQAVNARPDLKVLLASAYSEEMATARLSAPQVCGFIRKPFRIQDVLDRFRSAMNQS